MLSKTNHSLVSLSGNFPQNERLSSFTSSTLQKTVTLPFMVSQRATNPKCFLSGGGEGAGGGSVGGVVAADGQCGPSVSWPVRAAEELSPAQTEPTNTISVANTIVQFSRANVIRGPTVLLAHSAHNPPSQTFGATLGPYL